VKKENALFGTSPGNLTNISSSSKSFLGRTVGGTMKVFEASRRPQSVKRESSVKHLGIRSSLRGEDDENEREEGFEGGEDEDETMALQKMANNLLLKKINKEAKE